MFEQISGAHQAMLWLAAIIMTGFIAFTVFVLAPLIRFLIHLIDRVMELSKTNEACCTRRTQNEIDNLRSDKKSG